MKKYFTAFILCFSLVTCGGPPASKPLPQGKEVKPIAGWIQYCTEHKKDPAC